MVCNSASAIGGKFATSSRPLGEQLNVLSKGCEDAARQELSDSLRRVFLLQVAGENGKLAGHLSRNLRRFARWIEGERVKPDRPEAVLNRRIGKVFEQDAKRTRVREGEIRLAGEREIGIELEGVANVHHDQERRPTF
jgi:hypothetical protein